MIIKLLSPQTFIAECCELDPDASMDPGGIADALAGYRQREGKPAAPVTYRKVLLELATRGVDLTDTSDSAMLTGVRLSPAGEALVAAWSDSPITLRCGTCGEVRMPTEDYAVCMACSLFTPAPKAYSDVPLGMSPGGWWLQSQCERAERDDSA